MIWSSSTLQADQGNYKAEGQFTNCDGERRLFLASFFLPYNPRILLFGSDPKMRTDCSFWWPNGTIVSEGECDQPLNFIWVDSDGGEIEILQNAIEQIRDAHIIYTTTHFFDRGTHYQNLKFFLELNGFSYLTHWYWEGEKGNAFFVRKDILAAMLRSLNYHAPDSSVTLLDPEPLNLKPFLKPASNKVLHHSIDQIDFIYMINLDQRPEKFAAASKDLQNYGIYPYRFSAVNGWELPHETLEKIGVQFLSGTIQDKFMGTTYREVDGNEYISNELIQENGRTYFSLGLSRGAIGIVLSHLSILQDAYDSGYETIWVMEDDVEVIANPNQISELIRKLDFLDRDWDILFTDIDTKNETGSRIPCRSTAARPNYAFKPLSFYFQHFYALDDEISRIGMRYGAYSIILRRKGVEKILNFFKKYRVYLPYDMDFWLVPDLKMYTPNRDIISHRCGAPSDNAKPRYQDITLP